MIEYLSNLDTQLLLFINRDLQNSLFDLIFPFVTDLHKNRVLQIALTLVWLISLKWSRRAFFMGCGLFIALAVSDFLGSQIKDFFIRPRPDIAGVPVTLRSPHFGGGSFPSNHALNMFCLYHYISYFYPKARIYLFTLALMVAFSRVYCGVHFPSDVVSGASIGSLCGFYLARILNFLFIKRFA